MDVQMLREFFMWCTIINGAMLTVSSLLCMGAGDWVYGMQSRWFAVSREAFNVIVYGFIGLYKIFFLTFNLIPWVALLIVG